MEDGLLSLKWNNHKTTFFDVLRQLREKSTYTDVTVAVESKFYSVHKLVLSTCSEYFCEIFDKTPCKSPVIVLKDVRHQDLEALLDYMYLGEVNVSQNDLASLLKTAECLRIKGLAVPDEDVQKVRSPNKSSSTQPSSEHKTKSSSTRSQRPSEDYIYSPPPKRRRHEEGTTANVPPRSRSVSPTRSRSGSSPTPIQEPDNTPVAASPTPIQQSPNNSIEPAPLVKVEIEESEDPNNSFLRDNDFDGASADAENRNFEVEKTEIDTGYPGGFSAAQHVDLGWDEGESGNFPGESFGGDNSQHQSQGDVMVDEVVVPSSGDSEDTWETVLPPGTFTPSSSTHHHHHSFITTTSDDYTGQTNNNNNNNRSSSSLQSSCSTIQGSSNNSEHDGQSFSSRNRYLCNFCNREFLFPSKLTEHMRVHTGEKPFGCPYCSFRSSFKWNLKSHMQAKHQLNQPHTSNQPSLPSTKQSHN